MKSEGTVVTIYDTNDKMDMEMLQALCVDTGEAIQDFIRIDNHVLVQSNNISLAKYNQKEDMYQGLDVNIAIASTITATQARVFMSSFKNLEGYRIYSPPRERYRQYSCKQTTSYRGNKLGQLKLEYTIEKAIFIAPKVYVLRFKENKSIIKIKELKNINNLTIDEFEKLLFKDNKLKVSLDI